MKKILIIITTIIIMFNLYSINNSKTNSKGDLETYTYQTLNMEGFTLKWRTTTNSYLEVRLSAQTTGWVGVGFGATNAMANANIIIGYVQDNTAFIRDDFGVSQSSHESDISLGGADDLLDKEGLEENGITTIMFKMPLNSGDQYDKVLTPGQNISIILAKGGNDADNFTSSHSSATGSQIMIEEIPIAYVLFSANALWNPSHQALINWTTTDEMNLVGFSIYRNTSDNFEAAELLNPSLVSALNTTPSTYSYLDETAQLNQTYYYWIKGIELDNNFIVSNPIILQALSDTDYTTKPSNLKLQNYPNPFNPNTTISFTLPSDDYVQLLIYNARGQLTRTLFKGYKSKGKHNELSWDGKNDQNQEVGAGIYHLIFKSSYDHAGKKLILLK